METSYDKEGLYLGRLADVFGDPTRRKIYRHLRSCDVPQSASEVADVFGLHRTVARAHLEKLTEMDLVSTATRRRPGGGRPAKIYAVTDARLEIMLPPRRYERLARLLLQADRRDARARRRRRHGHGARSRLRRADGRGVRRRAAATARPGSPRAPSWTGWSSPATARPSASNGNGEAVIEVHNCVYRELSQEYPDVVCAFDRSMLCGMLGVDGVHPHADSRAQRRRHVLPARVQDLARPLRRRRPAPAP